MTPQHSMLIQIKIDQMKDMILNFHTDNFKFFPHFNSPNLVMVTPLECAFMPIRNIIKYHHSLPKL